MTTETISARQLDVLRAAAKGLTVKETARQLGITPDTAREHRCRAIKTLGSRNITQAAVAAVRAGLL